MKTGYVFSILLLLTGISALTQENTSIPKLYGPYPGQKVPGMLPELFAPGFICTGFNERDITISPDGKEIFYGFFQQGYPCWNALNTVINYVYTNFFTLP
jgi:hypothetical protein